MSAYGTRDSFFKFFKTLGVFTKPSGSFWRGTAAGSALPCSWAAAAGPVITANP